MAAGKTVRTLGLLAALAVCGIATASDCLPAITPEQAYLQLKRPANAAATQSAFDHAKRINLNTASEAELASLDGIGAKKAQQIILYRQMIAPFASVDELARVKGIGKATVDKNRQRLTVQ